MEDQAARTVAGFLESTGLGRASTIRALSGGVSSDIWRVDLPRGPACVKRALPRLRVAQLWEAPVERNRYERLWLQAAGEAVPGCAPAVLSWDDEQGLFAMQYLDYPVWKERLRLGDADPAFAGKVGAALAGIHAATAGREDVAKRFPTDKIFYAIRLEPYLVATAGKHPDLRSKLLSLAERTAKQKKALVHGDVSPKNILVAPRGPVFLDAECAWYGDPAFDLAFCLNHLILKSFWTPNPALQTCFESLRDHYLAGVTWESSIEERVATLLPGLLLARVDGKSPVEYLDEEKREQVRQLARRMLIAEEKRLRWPRSST
ncbi:MAG TPA: aminoglycoside phosphotransferase family protein [Burkholderiales bacterium]|nr:aminoglycoside phosphotransferase family protein [Burkholderiales bacterium]